MKLLNQYLSHCLVVVLLSSGLALQAQASSWIYTVVDGDNLWDLSVKHLDSVSRFEQLRKLNNIENPRKMQPGTRIRVPMEWIRTNPVPAEVRSINGQAQLTRAGSGDSLTVNPGRLIYLGDQIRTEANSNLAIMFADQTLLTIHENSLIRFDHLSAHGSTGMVDSRMKLLKGRMETEVTPASGPGSRFEIHTPSAISAVRGTSYRAAVAQQGSASNIEVLEGKVAVAGAKQETLVQAGYGTQIKPGQAPLAAKKLLPAPRFNDIPQPIRQLNWRLSWQPIEGAVGYRIEIADHADFETLLWQDISEYTKAALPDLPDQTYFIRVRAIDDIGLEGLDHAVKVELDARPQPPIPLRPVDGESIRGTAPELQWTASVDASSYHLEIATTEDFSSLLIDEQLTGSHFDTEQLGSKGTFFWRLTSITKDGERGPTGVARHYELKPIPAQVEAGLESLDDGELVASWMATSDEQHYQLQIAEDADFKNIMVDTRLQQPHYAFERHQGHTRYMRVKSIEQDGYESPWGSTQLIYPEKDKSYWLLIIGGFLGILL